MDHKTARRMIKLHRQEELGRLCQSSERPLRRDRGYRLEAAAHLTATRIAMGEIAPFTR